MELQESNGYCLGDRRFTWKIPPMRKSISTCGRVICIATGRCILGDIVISQHSQRKRCPLGDIRVYK